jgi:hypothetical protein
MVKEEWYMFKTLDVDISDVLKEEALKKISLVIFLKDAKAQGDVSR